MPHGVHVLRALTARIGPGQGMLVTALGTGSEGSEQAPATFVLEEWA